MTKYLYLIKYESYLVNWLLYFFEKENYDVPEGGYEEYYRFTLSKIDLAIDKAQSLAHKKDFKLYLTLVVPQAVYTDVKSEESKYTIADYYRLKNLLSKRENFFEIKIEDLDSPQHKYFSREGQDPLPFGSRHFNEVGYELMAQQVLGAMTASTDSAMLFATQSAIIPSED